MDILYTVFLLMGGVAMFLFGIKYMSDSLELALGGRLKKILASLTGTGLKAVATGAGVTALIQSSGATSVIAVGFVNAGLMNMRQALYTMLGANIGTCVTAQIIAFDIQDLAPLILFIGASMLLLLKNRAVRQLGAIITGFGLLFMGIYIMGLAVGQLDVAQVISVFLDRFSQPLICVLGGVVITAVIQSSSASIGILQVLAMSSASVGISLEAVMFLVLGMNIGACSPIIIASFTGGRNCRCAAFSDVIAKSLGVLFFSLLITLFPQIINWLRQLSPLDIGRQIANFHLLFNLIACLALYPLVSPICRLLERLFPQATDDDPTEQRMRYISNETLNVRPAMATVQAKREVVRMAEIAYDNLSLACDSLLRRDTTHLERIFAVERTLNFLSHEIIGFLVRLNARALTHEESVSVGMMFHVVSDIERIGDHAQNIAEYVQVMDRDGSGFSPSGLEEMREMSSSALAAIATAIEVYTRDSFDRLEEVNQLEQQVDMMQTLYVDNHLGRLKAGYCDSRGGVIFTDMLSDLERCSDHAMNIAFAIKGEPTTVIR